MPSQPPQPAQPHSGPSVLTLLIASASSVVAAVVVSRIWGPGTLIGAAATPIIVTLVSEALKKPAAVITVVRTPTGTEVHQPAQPRPRQIPADDLHAGDTVVATPPAAQRSRRPAIVAALVTGLIAAAIGIFLLTSGELVFGDSSVGSGGGRTSIGVGTKHKTTKKKDSTTPTVSTETKTETTTAPSTTTPPPTDTGEATAPSTPTETTPVVPPDGTTGATGATTP